MQHAPDKMPVSEMQKREVARSDSGQLEFHLLGNGFMVGFNHDEGREDEESPRTWLLSLR